MVENIGNTATVVATYRYDAYGQLIATTGDPSKSDYRFSTKPYDDLTGLYYYGYRYYDPVTGRWPSRDPIEEEGGYNLYGMVGNDAVGKWDYLGQQVNGPPIVVEGQARVVHTCVCLKWVECECCPEGLDPASCGLVRATGSGDYMEKDYLGRINGEANAMLEAKIKLLQDADGKCAKEKCPVIGGGACRVAHSENRVADFNCKCTKKLVRVPAGK